MKFLSKLGQILLKATEIWTGFSPIVAAAYPNGAGTIQTVSRDLTEIANIITTVEAAGQAIGSANGPQKLVMATPLVSQIILQSSLLANHSIANPDLFKQGSAKLADGMADILNSLKDNINTTNKA